MEKGSSATLGSFVGLAPEGEVLVQGVNCLGRCECSTLVKNKSTTLGGEMGYTCLISTLCVSANSCMRFPVILYGTHIHMQCAQNTNRHEICIRLLTIGTYSSWYLCLQKYSAALLTVVLWFRYVPTFLFFSLLHFSS